MIRIVIPLVLIVLAVAMGGTLFMVYQQYNATRTPVAAPDDGSLNDPEIAVPSRDDGSAVAAGDDVAAADAPLAAPRSRVPADAVRDQAGLLFLEYNGRDADAQRIAARVFNGIVASQAQAGDLTGMPDAVRALVAQLPDTVPDMPVPALFAPQLAAVDDVMPMPVQMMPVTPVAAPQPTGGTLPAVRRGTGMEGACRIENGARRCTIPGQ